MLIHIANSKIIWFERIFFPGRCLNTCLYLGELNIYGYGRFLFDPATFDCADITADGQFLFENMVNPISQV